jgi:protein-disulfide isomerase
MSTRFTVAATVAVALATSIGPIAARQKAPDGGASEPLARVGTRVISTAAVEGILGNKLLRLRVEEYRQKRQALDGLITDALLDAEAARRRISVGALLELEVENTARPVTDEETRAVYESARGNFGTTSEANALRTIADTMRRQRLAQRRQQFVEGLKRAAGVTILLEPPRVTVEPTQSPGRGPTSAPVTIVEFTDFQCPYCGQMAAALKQLEAKYAVQVRVVFRHFPLAIHPEAAKAAEAAVCADDQGKFWEMHDRLFANQKALAVADLKRHASALGLDGTAFAGCLDSARHAPLIQKDRQDGERDGVTGTPAVFINGRPVFGLAPTTELMQVVDEELAGRPPAAAPGGRRMDLSGTVGDIGSLRRAR